MNNTMIDTKAVILALKNVREEKGLSIDNIFDIVKGDAEVSEVSRTSIARVFREGSEDQIFKWEGTLKPIANALLDIDNIESNDDTDTQAYKAMLKLKKDLIEDLREEIKTVESREKLKYHEKLETERAQFHKSLDFLKEQVALKDKRIDQLLNANDQLSAINVKLTDRLIMCSHCTKEYKD